MIEEIVAKICGWMSLEECNFLHDWVKNSPVDALIVELGSWLGRSTASMYTAMHGDQTVVAVDSWLGQSDMRQQQHKAALEGDLFLQFIDNMQDLGINPRWYKDGLKGAGYIRALTTDAATLFLPNSIDRLFVDADHRFVGKDIDAFIHALKPGAEVAGHDYNWAGVKDQVEERFLISAVVADIWIVKDVRNGEGL